jgi:hypothetical protein
MIFLKRGAESFGVQMEYRCQRLLRPIGRKHLALNLYFVFGKFQDHVVIPAVAKLLEDVPAIFGLPVGGELHEHQNSVEGGKISTSLPVLSASDWIVFERTEPRYVCAASMTSGAKIWNYPAINWWSCSRSAGSASETAQKSRWPFRQSIHW